MPQLHTVREGHGPAVVLSHALGCDLSMWDSVAAALRERFTVVRYDHRGHGRSPIVPGAFSMDDLADDAAELIAGLNLGPVHFVGLSMGGMTAQALAARHPAAVRSLVIANSAQQYDEAARAGWQLRVDTVRGQGMAAIADGAMARWFTPEFRADAQGAALVAQQRAVLLANDPEAYVQACLAVGAIDLAAGNARLNRPTLVIGGTRDDATPMAMSEAMAATIPGARLRHLAASHLSAIEQPQAFAALLTEFWAGLPA